MSSLRPNFGRAVLLSAERIAPPPISEQQAYWQAHPIEWVEQELRTTPDPWQAEALTALANGQNIAVGSGHGVGKTAWLAWVVMWWLDTRPEPVVPCAAPTEHQLADLLWPEMERWLIRSDSLRSRLNWRATRIEVIGRERRCFAAQRPAGPGTRPENLAGFHAPDLMYVVDEAAGVADVNMTVVTGALTTDGARLVMAGNRTRTSGYFAGRFVTATDRWHIAVVSSLNSPRVSEEWAAEVAAEWGEDSDEYRVRVLGMPPRGDARGFISGDVVDLAMSRVLEADGPLVLGVDVARYGRDKTAFCARRGAHIVELRTVRGKGNPEVAQLALQLVDELGEGERVTINVDDDGVGGGVTDLLRVAVREGRINARVHGLSFGGAGDKFYATNAGVWWHRLRLMMRDGQLDLPDDPDLRTQLTDRTAAMNLHGKTVLEPKDHMRDRGVPSPDKADALALTVGQASGQGQVFEDMWRKRAEDKGIIISPDQTGADLPAPVRRRIIAGHVNEVRTASRQKFCRHSWGPPPCVCVKCGVAQEDLVRT